VRIPPSSRRRNQRVWFSPLLLTVALSPVSLQTGAPLSCKSGDTTLSELSLDGLDRVRPAWEATEWHPILGVRAPEAGEGHITFDCRGVASANRGLSMSADVALMTAIGDRHSHREATRLHATSIDKPFEPDDLVTRTHVMA
jgi:hypothetical protein